MSRTLDTLDSEREAGIEGALQPVNAHVSAVLDSDEWFLRVGAARLTRRMLEAKYRVDEPNLWRSFALVFYRKQLQRLRARRCAIERHHAKLQARGIQRELWCLHPYRSPQQKARDKEFLRYVRDCQQMGWPINWERRYH